MGYTKHGEITNFWPDDTDSKIYVAEGTSLGDIIQRATDKWPGVDISALNISSEYIHTHCLYYDRYDAGDYTNFIVITNG